MQTRRVRVLVVDDSATIRRNLGAILGELDAVEVVGNAADTQEGVKLARTLRPDVVTLDIRMPGASGLDAIQPIKQLDRAPIVMVLTNYPYSGYRRRAAEAGADYFFDKSTEFHKVLGVLRSGIERRPNREPGQRERSPRSS